MQRFHHDPENSNGWYQKTTQEFGMLPVQWTRIATTLLKYPQYAANNRLRCYENLKR